MGRVMRTVYRHLRSSAARRDEVPLDGFVLAVPPAPVRSAVDAHRRALDSEGIAYLHREEVRAEQAVLAAAAQYLETDPELVALTDSTSMGLGLIYGGALLAPGDELLTTVHDFYATHEAMRFAALRSGATVRNVRLYGDSAHASADRLATLNERRPEARRVLLALDGVHGFGVEATPVAQLGCDLFAAGCHKWLYGPRGTGAVWGRPAAWATLAPVIPSFAPDPYVAWMLGRPADLGASAWGATMTPGGYHSFEQRWALAPAFEFHTSLGRERVQQRILALTEQLESGLREIDGVRVRTPACGSTVSVPSSTSGRSISR